MGFIDTENYVFIPNPGKPGFGTFYELSTACENYEDTSFVLLPYKNPQKEKIQAKFYKVINKQEINVEASSTNNPAICLKAGTSRDEYIRNVLKLKEHIQLGNIYEVNYCIQFFAQEIEINPLQIFLKLCEIAKAPYSYLLKIGNDFVICASPELFLKKEGQAIYTKPIKGTIRRGKDELEDEHLKDTLFNNLKERTENVMAVDVARNDFSHFAKKGSVQVNKLYNIETFETVHQMVSTVICEIKEGTDFEKIIHSTFPMASMTGAPKLRAMQLIDTFENFNRENYSGAMGFIDEKGDFTLSVNIRSIFYNQKTKHLSVAVGGAITYLSEAEKEYEECLLKAQGLLKSLNAVIV